MDATSVTSPIGLWTAVRKPIVSNLGSAILKISGGSPFDTKTVAPWWPFARMQY